MASSYLIRTVFYVCRIRERWMPGWFDLAGHSHQIFDVLLFPRCHFQVLNPEYDLWYALLLFKNTGLGWKARPRPGALHMEENFPRSYVRQTLQIEPSSQLERNEAFKAVFSQEKNPQKLDGIGPSKAFFDKVREYNVKSPIQSGTLPENKLWLKSNSISSELFIIPRGISPEKKLLSKNRHCKLLFDFDGGN
ncbi:hypothetical protein RJ640_010041 [Escallonia rubra]|uniref:Uncharacterized protein n=1 Tax=Escallonia rubra TaxID=112253 RepID=A0AA88QXM5_9ASTE|nr:hypothetical protein RJ640_010041 [Escallonia rubra]